MNSQAGERAVHVRAGASAYDVRIAPGATLSIADALPDHVGRILLIEDTGVPQGDRDAAAHAIESRGRVVAREPFSPSESDKSMSSVERLLVAAANARLDRGDAVVALGGGIVGDVAGYVAASYRRGVSVVQCPTTLLSMVDASVGGKTGVNLSAGGRLLKNMAGAFHQPIAVFADTARLASLDERVYLCGLAECVKHALIAPGVFGDGPNDRDLAWIEQRVDALRARDLDTLGELIERHVGIKARVVGGDERETDPAGGRALLNLGHTFAHAIETLSGLTWASGGETRSGLMHGEAVALGLIAACETSVALGLIDHALGERVGSLLGALTLPTGVSGLPGDESIIDTMRDDKKVAGGVVRLILPEAVGVARIVPCDDASAIGRGLAKIRA